MNAARAADDAKRRKAQLSAIHVAKAQLGLDDDTYRAVLERVSASHGVAVRSAGDLTPKQRAAVLDELRRLGAQAKPGTPARAARSYPGRPHNLELVPMLAKIEAQLADMQLSWAYADAIANRMYRIQRCAWIRKPDQLRAIIAALDVEQEKRDLNAQVDRAMKALGLDDAQLVALFKTPPPGNWRRTRRVLSSVRDELNAMLLLADLDRNGKPLLELPA